MQTEEERKEIAEGSRLHYLFEHAYQTGWDEGEKYCASATKNPYNKTGSEEELACFEYWNTGFANGQSAQHRRDKLEEEIYNERYN